jgi:hypothetical protein
MQELMHERAHRSDTNLVRRALLLVPLVMVVLQLVLLPTMRAFRPLLPLLLLLLPLVDPVQVVLVGKACGVQSKEQ